MWNCTVNQTLVWNCTVNQTLCACPQALAESIRKHQESAETRLITCAVVAVSNGNTTWLQIQLQKKNRNGRQCIISAKGLTSADACEPRNRMRSVQAGTRRFSLVSYSSGFREHLSNWQPGLCQHKEGTAH